MLKKRLGTMASVLAILALPAFAYAQTAGGPSHGGAPGGGAAHGGPPGGGGPHGPPPGAHAPPGGYPRGGHFAGPGGQWMSHPAWVGGGAFNHWRQGHWWRGTYGGRYGAWWIVGPDWYWYPEMLAGIPNPYSPPGMAPGYWYYCDPYQQYYPFVGACPSPWRPVPPG
jgi:hypothetical protein